MSTIIGLVSTFRLPLQSAIAMSPTFYNEIKESLEKENEGYKTWISAHKSNYYTIDFYHGNIVETAFNEWIEKGMPL